MTSGLPRNSVVNTSVSAAHWHSVVLVAEVFDVSILDHGINVEDVPEPHRLAERGW